EAPRPDLARAPRGVAAGALHVRHRHLPEHLPHADSRRDGAHAERVRGARSSGRAALPRRPQAPAARARSSTERRPGDRSAEGAEGLTMLLALTLAPLLMVGVGALLLMLVEVLVKSRAGFALGTTLVFVAGGVAAM